MLLCGSDEHKSKTQTIAAITEQSICNEPAMHHHMLQATPPSSLTQISPCSLSGPQRAHVVTAATALQLNVGPMAQLGRQGEMAQQCVVQE